MHHVMATLDIARLAAALEAGEAAPCDLQDAGAIEALKGWALEVAEEGRYDEAEGLLADLALADPASAELAMHLGVVRAQGGAHAAAIEAYEDALERHVRRGGGARFEMQVRLLRARSRAALGETEEAALDLLLAAAGPDPATARTASSIRRQLRRAGS